MNVSVALPTYRRPQMLAETLDSVFRQTVRPSEILIGDNSPDDETEKLVEGIKGTAPVPIRYVHHRPALTEVQNVQYLFTHAQGELLLLMHDDDPLFERCIEVLTEPLSSNGDIVASFGLQRSVDENGEPLYETETINQEYFRTPDRAGLVDGLQAGAIRMFPNNGYMIRSDVAKVVGYNDYGRAGYAPDFYFGLRLGKLGRPFYFVNEYTVVSRMTRSSQSRGNPAADNAYRTMLILSEEFPSFRDIPLLQDAVRRNLPVAIGQAAKLGDTDRGWRWYFSEYHRGDIATLQGVKGAMKLLRASLQKAFPPGLRPTRA